MLLTQYPIRMAHLIFGQSKLKDHQYYFKKKDIVVRESLLQATFDHNIQFLIHLAGYASAQKYAANKNTGCWSDIGTLPGTAGFSVCCIDLSGH